VSKNGFLRKSYTDATLSGDWPFLDATGKGFLINVHLSPVLTDRVSELCKPCPVSGELQNIHRGKVFDAVGLTP
jgi:hypothetical protein